MRNRSGSLILFALFIATMLGCSKGANAGTPADSMVKLSQYGRSEYCSLACGADGTLHAIYTDIAEIGKPAYVYYRSSTDGGATWSENKNLSDDESGHGAGYCRIMIDGKGRAYAIWKYIDPNTILDGPGGYAPGILAYRCLEGGAWSKIVRFNESKVPVFSWFAAMGPGDQVNIVWGQANTDKDWTRSGATANYSNLIQQSILDGASPGTAKGLIVPPALPTPEQIEALHAAGKWGNEGPTMDGLWDLRGYIDAKGLAHFIAAHAALSEPKNTGQLVMYWDGTKLSRLYEFELYQTYNNFSNPWDLLVDNNGKEHLFRSPEKSEKQCVRDYSIDKGELGDPVDVIAPKKAPGKISDWQAVRLQDGTLVVMGALSEIGGWNPDDTDLIVSMSSGDGKWSTPANVTNNAGRATAKVNDAASSFSNYRPDYAQAVKMKDGIGLIIVNTEKILYGVNTVGVTSSGRAVTGMMSGSAQDPWVFFHKM